MGCWYCSISTHYTLHGGHSNVNALSGAFFVYAHVADSYIAWSFGAALSRVHIILFVVIVLAMVPLVVSFLLVLTLLLLLQVGTLVLL